MLAEAVHLLYCNVAVMYEIASIADLLWFNCNVKWLISGACVVQHQGTSFTLCGLPTISEW
jgi:hypothetical protein